MDANSPQSASSPNRKRLIVIVLLALLFLIVGAVLQWFWTLQPVSLPEPPPVEVRVEPIPERPAVPEPPIERPPERIAVAPPPRPRVVKRPRKRRRYRRRRTRRRPKPRPRPRPKPRPKVVPRKPPTSRPKPKPRPKPRPKVRVQPPASPVPGRLSLWHECKFRGPFELLSTQYMLDGNVVFEKNSNQKVPERVRVYQKRMAAGRYALIASVRLRGVGFGMFSHLSRIRVQLRNALMFNIALGKDTIITTRCHENPTLSLKARLRLKFDVRIAALPIPKPRTAPKPTVTPTSPNPTPAKP